MRRSIIRINFFILLSILHGVLGNAYANLLSSTEQRWIDAHPIVRFSIHEKYAPYLEVNERGESAVFHGLLSKLGEFTKQEFLPKWRKSDQEGLWQLANGEVDFIIDPPTWDDEYLKFGSLSEAIFWGHDAIVTKKTKNNLLIERVNVAYFDRGYENPPITSHPQVNVSSSVDKLIFDLFKNDIEAIVIPLRLAQQLTQKKNKEQLQVDGLYSREPFEYRWLISHQDNALHSVLESFFNNLDPISSRQLFDLNPTTLEQNSSSLEGFAPWISTLVIMMLGSLLIRHMHQKIPSKTRGRATDDIQGAS